jgi:hypothetical protein
MMPCFVLVVHESTKKGHVLSVFGHDYDALRKGYKTKYVIGSRLHEYFNPDYGRDDPFSLDVTNYCVVDCIGTGDAYENEILERFNQFPGGYVPYNAPNGPNSNTSAVYLLGPGRRPLGAPKDKILDGAPGIDADPKGFFK